jgi:hypothetical protein
MWMDVIKSLRIISKPTSQAKPTVLISLTSLPRFHSQPAVTYNELLYLTTLNIFNQTVSVLN